MAADDAAAALMVFYAKISVGDVQQPGSTDGAPVAPLETGPARTGALAGLVDGRHKVEADLAEGASDRRYPGQYVRRNEDGFQEAGVSRQLVQPAKDFYSR